MSFIPIEFTPWFTIHKLLWTVCSYLNNC
uniref:Uncharacterized protein n=1 Tax=Anguilla anguilla TaxID=7936 RepID=A0A0E9R4P7_ANGAN